MGEANASPFLFGVSIINALQAVNETSGEVEDDVADRPAIMPARKRSCSRPKKNVR